MTERNFSRNCLPSKLSCQDRPKFGPPICTSTSGLLFCTANLPSPLPQSEQWKLLLDWCVTDITGRTTPLSLLIFHSRTPGNQEKRKRGRISQTSNKKKTFLELWYWILLNSQNPRHRRIDTGETTSSLRQSRAFKTESIHTGCLPSRKRTARKHLKNFGFGIWKMKFSLTSRKFPCKVPRWFQGM